MPDDGNDRLECTFFRLFARFEYALKRTGADSYLCGDDQEAKPNWDRFASDIAKSFDSTKSQELKEAVTYLLEHPPQKQVVLHGALEWTPLSRKNESEIAWLLFPVRRIRNNLFHGGKFPSGPVAEPARDTSLLQAAIVVLRECATLEPSVLAQMNGFL